ncbi:BTAD domain-containing putative transcriptional regulator [Streptomyces sp. NPDC050418]|uniref:AfsR/SARP family transcriptional regulator n=1 Tax=Streptomyces sp. NPDC050418 TaxID=3365612 RepID=UPI00379E80E4
MEFRLLGGTEVWAGDGPVDTGTARQRRVLAALLMDANRPVTVAQLVDRVWGNDQPSRAVPTLYSYVSRLRRLLPGLIDRSSGGGYVLTADVESVDVHRFHRLIALARETGDDERAGELFGQALALWRGEPFADADTPWFNAARELLQKEHRAAELDHTDVRLRLGEHAAVLTSAAERTAAHPLDERLAAQYMLALYRCGQQADALAHYRTMHRTLAEELGIVPGHEIQRVHQGILTGSAELDAPRRTDAGAAPPPWPVHCQLPLDLPGFTGRTDEMRLLEKELTAPIAAPVVLCGSPGIGKSALAAHLGHRLRESFPDGQWYVHLTGNSGNPRDPGEAIAALLLASGQDPSTIPEPIEGRAAALRARLADRKVLLVLDDAYDAEQVRPLLPGTPGSAVVITSRSDLRGLAVSHAARTVPLDVLTAPEARSLLAHMIGAERVAAEDEAAAQLTGLCALLPLALRIAGSHLAARPARRLTDYVADLAGGERLTKLAITGDRQAAVRTAFGHSHATLEPDAAHLFALLGLHPGPEFSSESAAALLDCPPGEAERLLDRLSAASLLQHTGADRFRFHDLLRLYAAEHAADAPDRESAWRRLCDWYLATTDAATAFDYAGSVQLPRTRTPSTRFADRHEALAWLESERSALTALVLRAGDAGPRDVAWQLTDQLRLYHYGRRHLSDWKVTTTAAMAAAEQEGDVLAQALLWNSTGLLRQHTGDSDGAREALLAAQQGYRAAEFTVGEVAILTNLAIHHALRGEMRHAIDSQRHGLALLRRLDRPVLLARALSNTGLMHAFLGAFDEAVACTSEAIRLCRALDRPTGTIGPLVNRAVSHHGAGHSTAALADATEALRLHRDHPHGTSGPATHEILARIHRDAGDLGQARGLAETSLRAALDIGEPASQAESLITLGSVHVLTAAHDSALALLQEALELTRRHGFRHHETDAHTHLARLHLSTGARDTAAFHAEQGLAIARDLELRPAEQRALATLTDIRRR